MKYLISIAMLLILAGCVTEPDWVSGADCWRVGVDEDNTGRMTRYTSVQDIPVVRLDQDKLQDACGQHKLLWACYEPKADVIYAYTLAGKRDVFEERCHALLGREHNNCTGYGIGKDKSACDWNL